MTRSPIELFLTAKKGCLESMFSCLAIQNDTAPYAAHILSNNPKLTQSELRVICDDAMYPKNETILFHHSPAKIVPEASMLGKLHDDIYL